MNRDAVAGLEAGKIAEHRGDFIHAAIEFLVGDDGSGFAFWLRDENQRRFVLVLGEMAVHAVVAGIEFAADKPLPERWIAGVQRGVPILIPVKEFGVIAKAFRKVLFAETLDEIGIVQIGLPDKFRRRQKTLFLFPMHRDLRFVVFWHHGLRLRIFR